MSDRRYQHSPVHVKVYRWLRWRPLYALLALRAIWRDRSNEDVRLVWRIYKGLADAKMKHYYTLEEVTERLNERFPR